jgi:hypothetical protein
MRSRVRTIAGGALVVAAIIGSTAGVSLAGRKDQTVLRGDVMVGVSAPYTGAANAIRGINGGGAPWVIADAEYKLRASGRIEVEVEGLVLTNTGVNPAATFKVTVSCLTTDANGAAVASNVSTAPFPADAAGNAEVEAKLDLPSPCFAPIIFVANGNSGSWFAATGV